MNPALKSWNIDVSVLIIFFVRDDVLKETFESVRKARPRRLLLWQDGAREAVRKMLKVLNDAAK